MIEYYEQLSDEEKDDVKRVIQILFRQTFVLERKYEKRTGRFAFQKDYRILNQHLEFLREYFSIAGLELRDNSHMGVFYIQGETVLGEKLPRLATIYLLILKLIYDEQMETASASSYVYTSLGEINEKIGDFALLKNLSSATEMRKTISLLKKYQIIEPMDVLEDLNEESRMVVYPCINASTSAYFSRNLQRHLRFQYPTAIFQGYYFEIDNKGNPYYICPVLKANAGLFGAKDVKGAVISDPVTGKSTYYDAKDIPRWVDHVYDGRLLLQKYNWKGLLSNGYINSVFGKKGCKIATDDYGYRAIDGDIWAYTGVTSVNGDQSNIAFVLMNMRTSESKYYTVSGANEQSAMKAAEGQVQNLRYSAAFPALINVNGEPTYVMILKDKGGLVKMFAMVNVRKYNIVATSTTQNGVQKEYKRLLKEQGIISAKEAAAAESVKTKEITIKKVDFIPIEGNTYVYITDREGNVYKEEFSKNEGAIKWNAGDKIKISYEEDESGIYQITQ